MSGAVSGVVPAPPSRPAGPVSFRVGVAARSIALWDEDNLLVILGQFVSHFVSARISDVSGILIHRFCIRRNMLYQLCISDVSAMYQ